MEPVKIGDFRAFRWMKLTFKPWSQVLPICQEALGYVKHFARGLFGKSGFFTRSDSHGLASEIGPSVYRKTVWSCWSCEAVEAVAMKNCERNSESPLSFPPPQEIYGDVNDRHAWDQTTVTREVAGRPFFPRFGRFLIEKEWFRLPEKMEILEFLTLV